MQELTKKAIAEGTLRKYNLRDAQVGNKVQVGDKALGRITGEVIALWKKEVVFGWDTEYTSTYDFHESHDIYHAPLCWVEDKPVYKGDVLYGMWHCSQTNGYVIDGILAGSLTCGGAVLTSNHKELTWTKLKFFPLNINGYIVPAPERVPLEDGTEYWVVDLTGRLEVDDFVWTGDPVDERFLKRGLVHLTKEAALAHAEALLSFTERKK